MACLEQEIVDVTSGPSQQTTEEQRFWQIGKSGHECFLELYSRKLWTDVSIRCNDHMPEDPDDRLRAHKLVMAARSPAFSTMFYGYNSENKNEIHIPDYNTESVNAFLRSLYSDCVCKTMEVAVVMDVFKIAHMYQVSGICEKCVEVLQEKVSIDNACALLDMAMFYEDTTLKENVLVFIDDNAKAVLESESFLTISRETLQYILQGDTLFTDEINVLTAVTQWATTKLIASKRVVNATTFRELLGKAFYFLRMTAMSTREFVMSENTTRLHSHDECLEILSYITAGEGTAQTLKCHLPQKRVQRVFNIKYDLEKEPERYSTSNSSDIFIITKDDVTIPRICVRLPRVVIRSNLIRRQTESKIEMSNAINYELIATCSEVAFLKTQTVVSQASTQQELILDPPLKLKGSDVQVYRLNVTLKCKAFNNFELRDQSFLASAYTSPDLNTTIAFNHNKSGIPFVPQNNSVAGLTFLRQSKRDINGISASFVEAVEASSDTDNDNNDITSCKKKKGRW